MCYKFPEYGSTSFNLKWRNVMAFCRIHVILHSVCSNILLNKLWFCRIICISSFVFTPSVTTYPVATSPGLTLQSHTTIDQAT